MNSEYGITYRSAWRTQHARRLIVRHTGKPHLFKRGGRWYVLYPGYYNAQRTAVAL